MEGETMNTKRISAAGVLLALLLCSTAYAAGSFTDFTLEDLEGNDVSTRTLRQEKVLVVKLGTTWCGWCQRETQELLELREEFDSSDLAIVEVYIEEDAGTVAAKANALPFTILLDEAGRVANSYDVTGIPVLLVVDPKGEITYRGNFTPHATLVSEVKTALAAREGKPSLKTTAGKAQTVCPVMGGAIDKSVFADYKGQRIYFCCPGCKGTFEKDPEAYIKKMADEGVTPEKVAVICTGCGQIKGSANCCKPGQALCQKCGLVKDSPGCCKVAKGSKETVELCTACGFIKGSPECAANCAAAKATCAKCRLVAGSPGCCKSAAQIEQAGLCPKCGLKKGSADCCNLQGKELCATCGLVKGSPGCCKIT
jgi:peroxiredoxin/YHS domain-containing protein